MNHRRTWQTVGVAGGLAGAAATGAALSLAAHRRQRGGPDRTALATQLSTGADDHGALPAGVASSVTADDGVRLSCEEIEPAAGGPAVLTVVLVHGFALDRRTWHFQRRFLADLGATAGIPVRQVIYDQRSHGRSARAPRASCTIEQLGHDLDAVLRALAPEGPLVLAGHSMGGMTIMALAEQRPELFRERVLGVALVSTSAAQVTGRGLPGTFLTRLTPLARGLGIVAGWQPLLVTGARRVGRDLIWTLTRRFAYGDRTVDRARVDLVDAMISTNAVDALTDFVDTLGRHDRIAALPVLAGCEVLIAAGDADALIPFRHSEVIAAELPDATLVRLPGVGHMPMLERPEVIDAALADLIIRAAGHLPDRRHP